MNNAYDIVNRKNGENKMKNKKGDKWTRFIAFRVNTSQTNCIKSLLSQSYE